MVEQQFRRTKIVATVGPASGSYDMIRLLAQAGMDAVRLNFSHGTHEEHASRAGLTREVQAELGRPLALIADLQGPKLRVSGVDEARVLATGGEVVLAGERGCAARRPGRRACRHRRRPRARARRPHRRRPHPAARGGRVDAGRVRCRVVVGGEVKSNKGVNLPGGVALPIPSLSEKDVEDLVFALGLGVDYVALSFVRSAADIARAARSSSPSTAREARVIAKIEKAEAVDALDDILAEADAMMVARGDLGVEIGAEKVPMIQKQIILRSLEAGKPVITATQMLESMVEHAEPTRAEASDVANAILDGT